MYDLVLPETSRSRYEDLLKEADAERRALQVKQSDEPRWVAYGLLRLSQWLINSGLWLQARLALHPGLSQR